MGVYEHNRHHHTLKRNRGRLRGGLRPHLFKTGLRPEPDSEQLEGAEQIDSFGEIDCGFYLESYVRDVCLFVCFMILVLVPPLQANSIKRLHAVWHHFLTFYQRRF